MLHFDAIDIAGKRVLIREDLNVPQNDAGVITDDTRIQRALPTIRSALDRGAKQVIIMSHLGRPTEGDAAGSLSLAPVAHVLSEALGETVSLLSLDDACSNTSLPRCVLLENVRINVGEAANDIHLAERYAQLCDVFVMDAFATAHRAHASTVGVAKVAKIACAGPLLCAEMKAIMPLKSVPKRPLLAIVGGAKVSSKMALLSSLVDEVDTLIVGGGIANTFLAAKGVPMGASLYEPNYLEYARDVLAKAHAQGVSLPLPVDVLVGETFSAEAEAVCKKVADVSDTDMIMDVGPATIAQYMALISDAQSIMWNGPLGVFEFPRFSSGTMALARAIAQSDAYSLAGGGDTVAAVKQFKVADSMSYISTGGGAFLSVMEGGILPGIQVLEETK